MTEVYLCYEFRPSQTSHYHDTDDWRVAGVVEEEQDAELWVEPDGDEKYRKYEQRELNHVGSFHSSHMEHDRR